MGYMGDLYISYPKPYSIYLRGTIGFRACVFQTHAWRVRGMKQSVRFANAAIVIA